MRRLSTLPMLAAVIISAGCGVQGTPTPAALPFEPCDIPRDAIAALGIDPEPIGTGLEFVETSEWNGCMWDAGWYFFTVMSTSHTFDEVKTNPQSTDFEIVRVGDRDAVTYHSITDDDRTACDVAFESNMGSAIVIASTKASENSAEAPCAVALRSALSLDALLPR